MDYAALATQYGAIPKPIDYEALAAAHGAMTHTTSSGSMDEKPTFQGLVGNLAAGIANGSAKLATHANDALSYFNPLATTHNSDQRRADVVQGLKDMGANPNSLPFKGGEIGTEIAGTAGIPLPLATGATGAARIVQALKNVPIGAAGGAIAGGLTNGKEGIIPGAEAGGVVGPALVEALPAIRAVKNFGQNAIGDIADLFRSSGPENIALKGVSNIVGKDNISKVADALQNAKDIIPNSKPTVAEALQGIPEGSPLQAYQKVVASSPHGSSAEFGQRMADQINARQAALAERDATTSTMRETALNAANSNGGVKVTPVLDQIDNMMNASGNKSNDFLQNGLGAIKTKINGVTDANGNIDANELYSIRKNLGKTIDASQSPSAQWDKSFTGGLARDVQKHIDDAIETAGGTGWKDYLAKFSGDTKAVEADQLRTDTMYKPLQKTSIGGGIEASDATKHLLPNLLAKPITGTKWAVERVAAHIQPKVDDAASQFLLNPQEFGDRLNNLPPDLKQLTVDEILKRSSRYTNAAAVLDASRK